MCTEQSSVKSYFQSLNSENLLHPFYVPKYKKHVHKSTARALCKSQPDISGYGSTKLKATKMSRSLLMLNNNDCGDFNATSKENLNESSESLRYGKCKKSRKTKEVFDILRPRCYTDPGPPEHNSQALHITVPLLTIETDSNIPSNRKVKKKRKLSSGEKGGAASVFDSLVRSTLKLTTASMGMKAAFSDNRLTHHTSTPLNEDVKRQISRSASSVVTLPNGIGGTIANDATSLGSATSSTRLQSIDGLNRYSVSDSDQRPHGDPDYLTKSFGAAELPRQKSKPQYKQQFSLGSASSTQNSGYYSSLTNDSGQNLTRSYSNRGTRTLKQNKSESAISSNSTLGLDTLTPIQSRTSVRSISPASSRKSTSGSISSNNSDNTAKNEQSTAAAVASTTAVAATAAATTSPPVEKEKKRKEVSTSRVKKFHRHFSQVPKDEKLINYFSCALVGDILLQGHLYITDHHFAFYSNVFGYVTKVVIPTSSVTKISKEKTAKIIPNAVGVATADERHVFGSFISREAAFRLMCSVCPPLAPTVEILPKIPADLEISEEYSIEDDSSCSISGNESPPGNGVIATSTVVADTGQTLLRRTVISSSLNNSASDKKALLGVNNEKKRHSDIPLNAKATSSTASMQQQQQQQHAQVALRASAPPASSTSHYKIPAPSIAVQLSTPTTGAAASAASNLTMIIAAGPTASSTTSASSTSTPSTTSSSPTTVYATPTAVAGPGVGGSLCATTKQSMAQTIATSLKAFTSKTSLRLKFPNELSIVYLGVILSLVLAVFSVFLLYRIVDIEARTSVYRSPPIHFNWNTGHDDDIFAEALRWQRELQDKSTAEAQTILSNNLEQIAKVRRSLETLSMLIRDRSTGASVNSDDSSN